MGPAREPGPPRHLLAQPTLHKVQPRNRFLNMSRASIFQYLFTSHPAAKWGGEEGAQGRQTPGLARGATGSGTRQEHLSQGFILQRGN